MCLCITNMITKTYKILYSFCFPKVKWLSTWLIINLLQYDDFFIHSNNWLARYTISRCSLNRNSVYRNTAAWCEKKNAHLKKLSNLKLLISSLDQKISQQIFTEHAKNDGKNWPGRKYVLNKYLLQKSTEPVFLLKWIKKYLRCVLISRCLCKLRLLWDNYMTGS